MKKTITAVCSELDARWYLREWARYHFRLGFDSLNVYLNDVTVETLARTKDTDFGGPVCFRIFDGPARQLQAYNDWLSRAVDDWVLFVDVDEFLYLKNGNLERFLSDRGGEPALGLNWKLFGSNGHSEAGDRTVRGRFTKSQKRLNPHVKQFVNLKFFRDAGRKFRMVNPHFGDSAWAGLDGVYRSGPFRPDDGGDPEAYVAHYAVKSIEEFLERRSGPRADDGSTRTDLGKFWAEHDLNEVENFDLV